MIENKYAAILQHDSLKIKHPSKRDHVVELNRIIATRSFDLYDKDGNLLIHVKKYDIGGFIESIDNLDPENFVWIDHSARVFDNVKILEGSYIRNHALVFENAKIKHSEIANSCRVHGASLVERSKVLDLSEVMDSAIVLDSIIKNNSKIYKNAKIENSLLTVAATAHGDCHIKNSNISDISEIRGSAFINNCNYKGRVIRESGEFNHETLERDLKLEYREEIDESYHKQYTI